MLEHGAGAQVAQFGLDKSAQIARGAVKDAEHGMWFVVVLDDHAGTELGRWNRHCWFTSPYTLLGILGSGAGPGSPSGPVVCLLGVEVAGASAALRINILFYTRGERCGNRGAGEF